MVLYCEKCKSNIYIDMFKSEFIDYETGEFRSSWLLVCTKCERILSKTLINKGSFRSKRGETDLTLKNYEKENTQTKL